MKTSTKILIGVIVVISFLLGFFIGTTMDNQKADNKDLAGTIGKMNTNDMKAAENNANLLSDLRSNETLLRSYGKFYSFHFSSCNKLCEDIDFAIKAAENSPEFREDYSVEIENVKQYREALEQAKKDILLANTSLKQLPQADEKEFSQVIKKANLAVDQIKDKQKCLPVLVESIEKFMNGNNPYKFSNLVKAHDMFALTQLNIAP